jgi:hypothetical protein
LADGNHALATAGSAGKALMTLPAFAVAEGARYKGLANRYGAAAPTDLATRQAGQ